MTKRKSYSIAIYLYPLASYKGNCTAYFYGGKKRTKSSEYEPKLSGCEHKKHFCSKEMAQFNEWRLKEWAKTQLWVGSYFSEIITNY